MFNEVPLYQKIKIMNKNLLYTVFSFFLFTVSNAQIKILFDATKAETASNADWVIDADTHNLGFSNGPATVGGGNESNPQRIPTPAQSGITASTPETYWEGSLSNWGIDCVKKGYAVETLPYNGQITYGVSSNAQDLSNYKVFVVVEPNISFTASEKTAILDFIKNGGGLMMISDHTVSDRNNDGIDSPAVWNDFMTTNSVKANPFGIAFDLANFSETSSNLANNSNDPILHGTFGNVTKVNISGGTSITLNTTANTSAKGLVYKTGASATGNSNVLVASSTFQSGKVVAITDSSMPDDGTGDPNDTLYNGYTGSTAGTSHQILLMNSIIWLATSSLVTENFSDIQSSLSIAPNPILEKQLKLYSQGYVNSTFVIYDSLGREVKQTAITNEGMNIIDCSNLQSGVYFGKAISENTSKVMRFVISE